MAEQNRMGAKMQPCPEVVEILGDNFCPTVIRAPDTCTGILMKGSDQMEYDVRHALVAKCLLTYFRFLELFKLANFYDSR